MAKWAFGFILPLLLSVCSDDRSPRKLLLEADRCLVSDPDSADLLLTQVDSTFDLQITDQMYYELLRSQVDDALSRPASSDSVMLRVVDYYENCGSEDEKATAFLALGCLYERLNNDSAAVMTLMHSLSFQKETSPDRKLVSTLLELSSCYLNLAIYGEGIKYGLAGATAGAEVADTALWCKALFVLGRNYSSSASSDSAIACYLKVYKLCRLTGDMDLASISARSISRELLLLGNYEVAMQVADRTVCAKCDCPTPRCDYLVRASCHQIYGQLDSAFIYQSRYLSCPNSLPDQMAGYFTLSQMAAGLGRDSVAYRSLLVAYDLADSLLQSESRVKMQQRLSDYKEQLRQQQTASAQLQSRTTLIAIFSAVTVTLAFVTFHNIRVRRRYAAMFRSQFEASLSDSSKDEDPEIVRLRFAGVPYRRLAAYSDVFAKSAARSFMADYDADMELFNHSEWPELLREWFRTYSGKVLPKAEHGRMIDAMLLIFKASIDDIRSNFPSISDEDCIFCIFSRQQYSAKAISFLFHLSTDTLRQRKYRIKSILSPKAYLFFFGSGGY